MLVDVGGGETGRGSPFHGQPMTDTKWFFPTTQGGEESGLNDPGIEFFRQPGALARETLQNSGDASDGSDRPVTVTFELLELPLEQFPGGDRLREVIERCRDYMLAPCKSEREKNENGREWFESALKLLTEKRIPVLRIRDENTTGLEGGEDEEGKAWFRFIKKQGSASMHGAGGGSFGIGQRAPFAFSRLRTIFYSTLTREGQHAFIGKTILSSFREKQQVFRPIGFWGVQAGAANGVQAVRRGEDIPEVFRRTTVGTDLYIMGCEANGWQTRVVDSVVRHFFAAIHGGLLVVRLVANGQSQELNKTTIEQVVETRLQEALKAAGSRKGAQKEVNDSLGVTRYYLKALASPVRGQPFVREHQKFGKFELYVTLDPNAPSRTVYMRQPRILVHERTQRVLEGYAAVFLCADDMGNELLRGLEDPSHAKWDRERRDYGDRLLTEISAFVRDSLKELEEKETETPQDLPDLGRYLPEDEALRPGSHQTGTRVRTNRVIEEQTARRQQGQRKERAAARPRRQGHAQVLLLPFESGEEGAAEGLTAAAGGQPPGVDGSGASPGGGVLPGVDAPDAGVSRAGVGDTGTEGPGPESGPFGHEGPGSGMQQGSRGEVGTLGPEGPGVIEWQGTQAGPGLPVANGGQGDQSGGMQGPTGSSAPSAGTGPGLRGLSQAQVSFRAWFSPDDQTTRLLLRATRRGRASLRLIASGEDSDYELQVASAIDVRTGDRFDCRGDRILNLTFDAGQRRELRLELRPARRVALAIEVAHGA